MIKCEVCDNEAVDCWIVGYITKDTDEIELCKDCGDNYITTPEYIPNIQLKKYLKLKSYG